MIGRLSNIITQIKETLYKSTPLRLLTYLAIIAALLLFWLYSDGEAVAFVYNEF